MNKIKVEECERLCKLFLKRAKAWREATKPKKCSWHGVEDEYTPSAPKESGALRRTSMDLTRALAEMRKTY